MEARRIKDGKKGSAIPGTPTTLAKLEDPRAWHVRGAVGIRPKAKERNDTLALPMAPPSARSATNRSSKTVLIEEEYVERLGQIIEGDYYPHNSKMSRALLGMEGRGGQTPSTSASIGTPSTTGFLTPGGRGETPGSLTDKKRGLEQSALSEREKRQQKQGGALTRFVATHTSEDNESFAELQEKDKEAFRNRHFWAYEEGAGNGTSDVSSKLLLMPSGHVMSAERRVLMDAACAARPKIGDDRPSQVDTWKHRTRNQLMFSPSLAKSNDTCRIEGEARSAPLLLEGPRPKKRGAKRPSGTTSLAASGTDNAAIGMQAIEVRQGNEKARDPFVSLGGDKACIEDGTGKNLAVAQGLAATDVGERAEEGSEPSGDGERSANSGDPTPVDNASEVSQGEAIRKTRRSAPIVVNNNPKVIQAHATRFPMPKARPPRGAWASPIESPSSSRESVAELLASKSDNKEFGQVPMTPTKVPGVDGDSPLVTWGSIDGTPMILDPRSTPLPNGSTDDAMDTDAISIAMSLGGLGKGRTFEVKDLPARDKLAHNLEAADTRRKRAKLTPKSTGVNGSGSTPSRTPSGAVTPSTPSHRRETSSKAKGSSAISKTPLTPAGRTLAARLSQRRKVETPFGGGLTPGRQRRRSSSKSGSAGTGNGRTPVQTTPNSVVRTLGGGVVATPTSITGLKPNGSTNTASITDGLLALK